ncbi:MAG: imidazole glycerol phosphate synthase subunit HisH [Magnetococcales bacterium]|nr:imidazole glycerol phosphate synthase subunit HisH [Magnetococcales bacterium]
MIVLVDYGSGNLRSAAKALESVGGRVEVTSVPAVIREAGHLVLPGVGAFADCRNNLLQAGLWQPVLDHIQRGKPFLGICVGMQLLFSESLEFGHHQGFGLIAGRVDRFSREMPDPGDARRRLKVPHMGWNRVHQTQPAHPLWQGIAQDSHFYFVHSYFGTPDAEEWVQGRAVYGLPFTAAVGRDNLFGTQFHPEKSQHAGLKLLENFVRWNP